MDIPKIGLGTWQLRGADCFKTVQMALQLGYRHIDTAHAYENHEVIGRAIQGFDRSQLTLTSKLAIQEQVDRQNPQKSVREACEKALQELGTDYLDLYLIHFPDRSYPLEQIFRGMEKLKEQGKVKQVGVSNYTIHHLQDLLRAGGRPFANQVEYHPYLNQQELFDFCVKHQIQLVAYRPFGKGKLLIEEQLLAEIGAHHQKTGAQVVLRWLLQKGIPVIPKASSEVHLRENLEVFDFVLTQAEMERLDALNHNKRYCQPENPVFRY